MTRVRGAFPAALKHTVEGVLRILQAGPRPSAHDIGEILIHGEAIHIPARIYFPEPIPEDIVTLDDNERIVLACLFSRHHDGYVRQKHLPNILKSSAEWVPPFVFQLCGEYVIQILNEIEDDIKQLPRKSYLLFAAENPAFIALTKRRIVSYWAYYFRQDVRFLDSPGFKIMDSFNLWERQEVPREWPWPRKR